MSTLAGLLSVFVYEHRSPEPPPPPEPPRTHEVEIVITRKVDS